MDAYNLGLLEYGDCCRLQWRLNRLRLDGEIEDLLLLLEHPPTFSIGKSGNLNNILVSIDRLRQEGISLFSVQRGGDVTYHGPGQLVVYPIISLRQRGKDVHSYVYDLEEVLIRTLSDFCINACRDKGHAGVWVNKKEVASIGLGVRRWITMHGFALNIDPDLERFSFINPCGYSDRGVASMSEILGFNVPMEEVKRRVVTHFSSVFDADIKTKDALEVTKYI